MSLPEFYGLLITGLVLIGAAYWLGVLIGRQDEEARHHKEIEQLYQWRRRR